MSEVKITSKLRDSIVKSFGKILKENGLKRKLSSEIEEGIYQFSKKHCKSHGINLSIRRAVYEFKAENIKNFLKKCNKTNNLINDVVKKKKKTKKSFDNLLEKPKKLALIKVENLFPEYYVKILNKRERKEHKKKNIAYSTAFKCTKCGIKKASYYQLQTRSADEPMTTFFTCLNCNNKWRV